MSSTGDVLATCLLYSAFLFGGAVGVVTLRNTGRVMASGLPPVLAVCTMSLGPALLLGDSGVGALLALTSVALAFLLTARWLRGFAPAGRLLILSHVLLIAWGLPWGVWFIATLPVSAVTRVLLFASFPFVLAALPIGIVATFEAWEVLCRERWRRPREPHARESRRAGPKVSIHVPVCSEPPELVRATLEAIARLDYLNFEVLVIDNNTANADLWRPVQQTCERLGERFRFYHLESWPGAKGGALNFALSKTAPDAEIVSVVDADYLVEPYFLSSLVAYFDDPQMGFVQTPHHYREWQASRYLRWCNWEYKYFFGTTMVSLNERDAAIIVGTMCLIRKTALEIAGGWSEQCLTEDSEVAIRIHAAGYSSVYLTREYGRGLIPETFGGFKKQRFRWTYGPIQEFQEHLRLFLPRPLGKKSQLTFPQKVHHLNHGLDRINVGIGLVLIPIGIAVIASMVVHREIIPVPLALVAAATSVLVGDLVLKLLIYRMMGCSLPDTLGALITSRALTHAISMASLAALFRRPARWLRTNKFRTRQGKLAALASARTELLIGMSALSIVFVVFCLLPQSGLLLMLLIGGVYQSLNYLSAPFLALIAE